MRRFFASAVLRAGVSIAAAGGTAAQTALVNELATFQPAYTVLVVTSVDGDLDGGNVQSVSIRR